MTNELRPPIEHIDYISDELKQELTRNELVLLRSVDVNNPISVYHGFPEVQLEMIQVTDYETFLEEEITDSCMNHSVCEQTAILPSVKRLRDAKTKEERSHIIARTTIMVTITGPSDRTKH